MHLLIQPYGGQLGSLLREDLNSGKFQEFRFSVAYAKLSGVAALGEELQAFRSRGGTVRATVGIDQNNTSLEALREILAFSRELYIFHNRSLASTFHPKVYLLRGGRWGRVYVGSNNLTGGGLYTNYETAAWEEFDLEVPEQAAAFAEMEQSLEDFCREGPCCRRADGALLQQLRDARQLCLERELRPDIRPAAAGGSDGLFAAEAVQGSGRSHSHSPQAGEAPPEELPRRFYKRLSRNDVDKKSSPGQVIIPIGFKGFFEPLSEPVQTRVKAMQSERYFHLLYENTGTLVENARVIFYEPASIHKRKNSELRFAMRSREIFGNFAQGDVLVFTRASRAEEGQYACTVRWVPGDDPEISGYPGRFGWLQE